MLLKLQTLIDDRHHLYRQSLPEKTLKPKHHFRVHYPQFIKKWATGAQMGSKVLGQAQILQDNSISGSKF